MRTRNSFLWERSFIGLRSIDEPATHIPDLASKTCTKPTLGTPRSASAVTHSSSGRIIARVSGQSNGSCFFGYGKRRSLTSMPRDVARETQQGITSPIEWTSNMAHPRLTLLTLTPNFCSSTSLPNIRLSIGRYLEPWDACRSRVFPIESE